MLDILADAAAAAAEGAGRGDGAEEVSRAALQEGRASLARTTAILPELRRGILAGYARRYCRATHAACEIEVHATVRRLTADNLDLHGGTRTLLMRIANDDGEARVTQAPAALPAFT